MSSWRPYNITVFKTNSKRKSLHSKTLQIPIECYTIQVASTCNFPQQTTVANRQISQNLWEISRFQILVSGVWVHLEYAFKCVSIFWCYSVLKANAYYWFGNLFFEIFELSSKSSNLNESCRSSTFKAMSPQYTRGTASTLSGFPSEWLKNNLESNAVWWALRQQKLLRYLYLYICICNSGSKDVDLANLDLV